MQISYIHKSQSGILHLIPIIVIAGILTSIVGFNIVKQTLPNNETPQNNTEYLAAFNKLSDLKTKLADSAKKGASTSAVEASLQEVVTLLGDGKYLLAQEKLATLSAQLDTNLALKLEADKKAEEDRKKAEAEKRKAEEEEAKKKAADEAARKALVVEQAKAATAVTITQNNPAPVAQAAAGAGYARISVGTDRGNFTIDVITADVGSTRVITDAGSANDCYNASCVAMPLADYVRRHGGYAGINGTYFCPPDYANCGGTPYSFSWFVFNFTSKNFLNGDKRGWGNAGGLMVFRPGSIQFQGNPSAWGMDSSVTGAVASWPRILQGDNVQEDPSMDDKQRTTKGNRGGICHNGNTVRLIIARGATVVDLGYIMKALGCTNGINLDGGGSSALYFNGYKVGPGRLLPNAIILAR